jgi:predicted lipoprotein with Yx(FWY)xxD motif
MAAGVVRVMSNARGPGAGSRLLLRVIGAGLLIATAAIHLDLYLTGYSTIPTIGPLFLLQVIAGFGLGLLVLATGDRLIAAAGALFALSTLGGYLISVQFGLFGFREVRTTAGIWAGILEIAAFAVLAALAALPGPSLLLRMSARGTGVHEAGARGTGARGTGGGTDGGGTDGGTDGGGERQLPGQAMLTRYGLPAAGAVAIVAAVLLGGALAGAGGAGGSGGGTTPVAGGAALGSDTIGGVKVLTNAQGRTLYWFAPDTSSKSTCYGTCAQYWPPVSGPDHAGNGVTGTLGTIQRTGGGTQETYDGHPLYTYIGDTGPGQAHGNNVNLNGGLWHEVVISS